MYERAALTNVRILVLHIAFIAIVFLVATPAQNTYAAVCENGVLKDAAGGTVQGTCTSSAGGSATVTCTNGTLTDGSGANVGTCAAAQQASGDLLRDGVFGCSASQYANVGSLSAIGGVYVPVNDAAVTLNTGYLVYKECVLDGVTARISEAARTDLAGTVSRRINTGRKGQPLYPQNYGKAMEDAMYRGEKTFISATASGVMCPAFEKQVVNVEVRSYAASRNASYSDFACTFPKSINYEEALQRGGLKELDYFSSGPNDPLSATLAYREAAANTRAAAWWVVQQSMNNNFYPFTDGNDNPFEEKILTPAYLVSEGAGQAFTSGFRCLEGADELSEICAPLFTSMVPESFSSGLYNMTRAQNGLPSYVSRMTSEAAAAVRAEAVNVALNVLLTARQFEAAFLQAKEASATLLTNAINRLRATEKTCWDMIAYNEQGQDRRVCTSAPQGNRCTAADGSQLTIATSTQFSQAIINASIAPLAIVVAEEIPKSVAALGQLDEMIAEVSNSSSATNQRAALSRLDALVAPNSRLPDCSPQKTLHSAGDVQCANKQRDDISAAIGVLVDDTIRAWGDSMDPNVGWCNINNPAVITKWTNEWK